jgi:hypothetical protein
MVSKSESGHSKDEERKVVKVDDPFSGSRLPDRERPAVRTHCPSPSEASVCPLFVCPFRFLLTYLPAI